LQICVDFLTQSSNTTAPRIRQPSSPRLPAMEYPSRCILPAVPQLPILTNGAGAATILAAGIGSFALAELTCVGDKSAAVKEQPHFL
jgi:hypothetical protein